MILYVAATPPRRKPDGFVRVNASTVALIVRALESHAQHVQCVCVKKGCGNCAREARNAEAWAKGLGRMER